MTQRRPNKDLYTFCLNFLATAVLGVLAVMILSSCSTETSPETAATDQGLSQSYFKAPISLELRINQTEITLADQLALVLETSVPENMTVEFPIYSASVGDFTLKDTLSHPDRMTGSGKDLRVVHKVTYLLEPYLPGTYIIPAMTVAYHEGNKDADRIQLVTGETAVAVRSLLDPGTDAIEIRDIKPPLSLPPDRTQQFLSAGLAFLLAAIVAAGLMYRRKKVARKLPAAAQTPPGEKALLELDKLLADDLLTRGGIKLFHLRISDILRQYIENRFGVKAPERTTEEFLTELSRATAIKNTLLAGNKTLLADFLTQCDLVKFARHEPSLEECHRTVVICREFIEKTSTKIEDLKN